MARADDRDIDIPGDEDENVGGDSPKKKREKKKKSKEERIAERKVIFWTLLIVMMITLGFWLMPSIGSLMKGNPVKSTVEEKNQINSEVEKPKSENYMEFTL